jgi:outer membrane receptor for Fe3+-dicitrate
MVHSKHLKDIVARSIRADHETLCNFCLPITIDNRLYADSLREGIERDMTSTFSLFHKLDDEVFLRVFTNLERGFAPVRTIRSNLVYLAKLVPKIHSKYGYWDSTTKTFCSENDTFNHPGRNWAIGTRVREMEKMVNDRNHFTDFFLFARYKLVDCSQYQ